MAAAAAAEILLGFVPKHNLARVSLEHAELGDNYKPNAFTIHPHISIQGSCDAVLTLPISVADVQVVREYPKPAHVATPFYTVLAWHYQLDCGEDTSEFILRYHNVEYHAEDQNEMWDADGKLRRKYGNDAYSFYLNKHVERLLKTLLELPVPTPTIIPTHEYLVDFYRTHVFYDLSRLIHKSLCDDKQSVTRTVGAGCGGVFPHIIPRPFFDHFLTADVKRFSRPIWRLFSKRRQIAYRFETREALEALASIFPALENGYETQVFPHVAAVEERVVEGGAGVRCTDTFLRAYIGRGGVMCSETKRLFPTIHKMQLVWFELRYSGVSAAVTVAFNYDVQTLHKSSANWQHK